MILRFLTGFVALTLGVTAVVVLAVTSSSERPDGSPDHPFPSVMPYPEGWKP